MKKIFSLALLTSLFFVNVVANRVINEDDLLIVDGPFQKTMESIAEKAARYFETDLTNDSLHILERICSKFEKEELEFLINLFELTLKCADIENKILMQGDDLNCRLNTYGKLAFYDEEKISEPLREELCLLHEELRKYENLPNVLEDGLNRAAFSQNLTKTIQYILEKKLKNFSD